MTLNNLKEALIQNNIKLLEKVKSLVAGAVDNVHTHENKEVIDKFSESEEGVLLFNSEEIKGSSDITISQKEGNAIESKEDGIYVKNTDKMFDEVNQREGIQDVPVGHIMAYMGNNVPVHYLACDGSVYNITDYPYLSEFILNEFGGYDYFGGDGVNTFAVPDLRGEFLRGTGENSYENQGSGSEVGKHQDATYRFTGGENITSDSTIFGVYVSKDKGISGNHDSTFSETGRYANYSAISTGEYTAPYYTARPTNTSVLYCIKYEPTYYVNVNHTTIHPTMYSKEEQVIGCWTNGKPVYQISFDIEFSATNNPQNIYHSIADIDRVIDYEVNAWNSSAVKFGTQLASGQFVCGTVDKEKVQIHRDVAGSWGGGVGVVTIQYTKTTDEENSFSFDMIKDFMMEEYTDEEIETAIADTISLLSEEVTS